MGGYTSVRLASHLASALEHSAVRCISLEVDQVHCAIAHHFVDLVGLSGWSEIWSGQVRDLIARTTDEFGSCASTFVFLDHRGTRFHTDFALAMRVGVLSVAMQDVADNVLNPGSPIFAWESHNTGYAIAWSLPEYVCSTKEDWMLVGCWPGTSS